MPRDFYVYLFLGIAVSFALTTLYGYANGFVYWGRTTGGPWPRVYQKDNPRKFTFGILIWLLIVVASAGLGLWFLVHFPEGWIG